VKPYIHAQLSAKKYGGTVDDYLDIHNFLDSSKAHVPDMRHRALLHNSFGIYVAENLYGVYRENSEGKIYSVRDICEDHVLQDLGTIPTVQDYLEGMPMYDWIGGKVKSVRTISLVD
jgi:hypothetical protein